MYVCVSSYSVSIQFFCCFSLLYPLFLYSFIYLFLEHSSIPSVNLYLFFQRRRLLCPIQFTFSCCLSAFVLRALFFWFCLSPFLLVPSLNLFLGIFNLSLVFLSPNSIHVSSYLCGIFLTFLFLCLLRLPTFCVLNLLVLVPRNCLCVLIIYQHFIAFFTYGLSFAVYYRDSVRRFLREGFFSWISFFSVAGYQQPQQPIVAGVNDNFLQFVACVNDTGDYTVKTSTPAVSRYCINAVGYWPAVT